MAAAATTVRTILVERLAWRDELLNVFRLGGAVVIATWLYLAMTLTGGSGTRSLLPFQQLIQSRGTVDQRMFRELQEGLLEAETIRNSGSEWPAPGQLAADGIPPFALDPTVKGVRYGWSTVRSGTYINHLGIPDREGLPAWLLLIQEPEPGTPPDQPLEDEEHHKLLDGRMLHVSTWSHADGARLKPGLVRVPQAEGWIQLYAVGPGK